jgi:hypothetical protein
MLHVPKSLLAGFADYVVLGVDADAMLEHLLGNPDRFPASLDLMEIGRRGLDDAWTSRHLEHVAVQLAQGCLRHRRYFDGVSIQDVVISSGTEGPSDGTTFPQRIWAMTSALGRRFGELFRGDGDQPPQTALLGRSTLPWTAHPELQDEEIVLIEAPICIVRTGDTESAVFLCDYPKALRGLRDPVIPLGLSSALQQKLIDQIGQASEWNPLFRILGTVKKSDGKEKVGVVALFSSGPKSPVVDWKRNLFKEAEEHEVRPVSEQAVYLRELLLNLELLEAAETDEEKKSHLDSIKREYADSDSYKANGVATVMRKEDDLQNAFGFWPALIAILRAWPDRFRFSAQELDRLLRSFDRTFNEEWKTNQMRLDPLDFFRFTVEAADSMRQDLVSLKMEPSPAVPAGERGRLKFNL